MSSHRKHALRSKRSHIHGYQKRRYHTGKDWNNRPSFIERMMDKYNGVVAKVRRIPLPRKKRTDAEIEAEVE